MAAAPKESTFNPIYVFREQGANGNIRQRPDLAKKAFNKSLGYSPNDRRALLGRSEANLRMYESLAAQKDAEQVLVKNPKLNLAKSLKYQAQYQSGEYEAALLGNRTGLKERRCPIYFDLGTMVTEETIEDCIGRNVGPVLLDSYKSIQAMLAYEQEHEADEEPPVLTEGQLIHKQRRKEKMEKLYGEKYLGRLNKDKIFLENFVKNPHLQSPNKIGTAKIRAVATEASNMLHERMEVLRERKPFCALKYHEATVSAKLQRRKQEEFEKKQYHTREQSKNQLEKLRAARESRELKTYLDSFELALQYFDGTSEKLLPKKQDFLEATYNITSLAFMDMMRANAERPQTEQVARVHLDLGLPYTGSDSAMPQQKARMPIIDVRKHIKNRERRLAEAMSATEKAWIFYELCRLNFEFNKFDLSRMFAKKCYQEARATGHLAWCVNASLFIVRIEVIFRNKSDVKAAINDAIDAARKLKDEAVTKYLKLASQAIDDADFEDMGDDGIEAREKRLLQLMAGTGIKEDMAYLFRRMKMMDANRRMSIMPGVQIQDRKTRKEGEVSDVKKSGSSVRTISRTNVSINKQEMGKRSGGAPAAQSAVAPTSNIARRRSVAPTALRLGLDDD